MVGMFDSFLGGKVSNRYLKGLALLMHQQDFGFQPELQEHVFAEYWKDDPSNAKRRMDKSVLKAFASMSRAQIVDKMKSHIV